MYCVHLLTDFVDKLFQEGLENSDMESLITGMLLIRQACFHGPHVFMSYSDWFQVSDIVYILRRQGTGHQLKTTILLHLLHIYSYDMIAVTNVKHS